MDVTRPTFNDADDVLVHTIEKTGPKIVCYFQKLNSPRVLIIDSLFIFLQKKLPNILRTSFQ